METSNTRIATAAIAEAITRSLDYSRDPVINRLFRAARYPGNDESETVSREVGGLSCK